MAERVTERLRQKAAGIWEAQHQHPFVREVGVESSRLTDDLLEDALAGYLAEAAEVRGLLDGRYDDIKSGRVTPIEGETFFESSRQSEHGWFGPRNPK